MEIYSTREAAKVLGLSQKMVTYLLRHGKLKGRKLGHDWVVLELNYERKGNRGRPRKVVE